MNFFQNLFGGGGSHSDGETPEFKEFVAASMEGLQLQTSAHGNTWSFGDEDSWSFSQDDGELVFLFPDKEVRAPAQIIGTYDSNNSTWMWCWANPSISESLARDSILVRQYGEQHKITRLTERKWAGEEHDAWEMTALACRLGKANGAYRAPAGTTYVFFTFGKAKMRKLESH